MPTYHSCWVRGKDTSWSRETPKVTGDENSLNKKRWEKPVRNEIDLKEAKFGERKFKQLEKLGSRNEDVLQSCHEIGIHTVALSEH